MRRRGLQALRRCGAVSRAMDRIWIAMGMGWGVNLGGGDAGVMLKDRRVGSMPKVSPLIFLFHSGIAARILRNVCNNCGGQSHRRRSHSSPRR